MSVVLALALSRLLANGLWGPVVWCVNVVFDTFGIKKLLPRRRIDASPERAYICEASDEVVLKIFSFLDEKDLRNVAQTCTKLHRLAQDDSLWITIFRKEWGMLLDVSPDAEYNLCSIYFALKRGEQPFFIMLHQFYHTVDKVRTSLQIAAAKTDPLASKQAVVSTLTHMRAMWQHLLACVRIMYGDYRDIALDLLSDRSVSAPDIPRYVSLHVRLPQMMIDSCRCRLVQIIKIGEGLPDDLDDIPEHVVYFCKNLLFGLEKAGDFLVVFERLMPDLI
eukprot:Colp12_sorted_trinity150504_noHs@29055